MQSQRVSMKKDGVTWCRPSKGYSTDDAIGIEIEEYVVVAKVSDDLPDSDEVWPRGAPVADYVKVGNMIFKKKS